MHDKNIILIIPPASAMGKSRSAAIIIAYLLLTRPTTCPTVSSALSLLRQTRPMAEPNRGFMAQLELYKSMGCPANIDSQPPYQRWLYKQEVELSIAARKVPDWIRFEDEEPQDGAIEREKELRCRKCRRTLATAQYLVPHGPKSSSPATISPSPSSPAAAAASSPSSPVTAPVALLPTLASTPCTHHFLQPLSWMRPTLERGELAGRLECPNEKCRVSIGRYAWQGFECSCGVWVVPAFSLAAGKVDEVTKGGGKGGAGVVGVRMPPGMGRGSL
jgi:dual specificity phosphatase 12